MAFGLAGADAAKAKTPACSLTSEESVALNEDASTDVQAIPNYQKTISRMLQARRFEQLDCLADSARFHKEMFPGGSWKLRTIYGGLDKPLLHATPLDWKRHIALLDQWVSAKPHSITARVALARAYIAYAWDARGHGFADTVSENGWKVFDERVSQASHILKGAQTLQGRCPEWYAVMQDVALAQGWSKPAKQALLVEAVKFEPDYYYYYRGFAVSVLPQWDGKPGEIEAFVQQAADNVGGAAGDKLYFQVVGSLVCCISDQNLKFSWPRIQKGFDVVEKQNGASLDNWNRLARLAAIYNDIVATNKMMARIGEQWSEDVWQTPAYFESIKEWAGQASAMLNAKGEQEQFADANLQTAEGKSYKVSFDQKVSPILAACQKEFGSGSGDSKLLVRIGKDGVVNLFLTVGLGRVGPCVMRKVGMGPSALSFPPPPKPDYWVRVDLDSTGY
jgi:hypothetical protein